MARANFLGEESFLTFVFGRFLVFCPLPKLVSKNTLYAFFGSLDTHKFISSLQLQGSQYAAFDRQIHTQLLPWRPEAQKPPLPAWFFSCKCLRRRPEGGRGCSSLMKTGVSAGSGRKFRPRPPSFYILSLTSKVPPGKYDGTGFGRPVGLLQAKTCSFQAWNLSQLHPAPLSNKHKVRYHIFLTAYHVPSTVQRDGHERWPNDEYGSGTHPTLLLERSNWHVLQLPCK